MTQNTAIQTAPTIDEDTKQVMVDLLMEGKSEEADTVMGAISKAFNDGVKIAMKQVVGKIGVEEVPQNTRVAELKFDKLNKQYYLEFQRTILAKSVNAATLVQKIVCGQIRKASERGVHYLAINQTLKNALPTLVNEIPSDVKMFRTRVEQFISQEFVDNFLEKAQTEYSSRTGEAVFRIPTILKFRVVSPLGMEHHFQRNGDVLFPMFYMDDPKIKEQLMNLFPKDGKMLNVNPCCEVFDLNVDGQGTLGSRTHQNTSASLYYPGIGGGLRPELPEGYTYSRSTKVRNVDYNFGMNILVRTLDPEFRLYDENGEMVKPHSKSIIQQVPPSTYAEDKEEVKSSLPPFEVIVITDQVAVDPVALNTASAQFAYELVAREYNTQMGLGKSIQHPVKVQVPHNFEGELNGVIVLPDVSEIQTAKARRRYEAFIKNSLEKIEAVRVSKNGAVTIPGTIMSLTEFIKAGLGEDFEILPPSAVKQAREFVGAYGSYKKNLQLGIPGMNYVGRIKKK